MATLSLSSGSRLGPYEILSPIGAGGMGEVWKARDPRLDREVAIKVLPPSFSTDPERLRRFEQEARAAGRLNHPNLTAVYDIGSHEGVPYIVQELLEGESLRAVLAGGGITLRTALDYALQIAHGLAAAHEKGIVHRDIKPENLFVARDGRVKILDFGLASWRPLDAAGTERTAAAAENPMTARPTVDAPLTEPGTVLGTLGYMSPEQLRGKPADARSDIFALGSVLYEMLAGRRAFAGDSAADTISAILREEPSDLSVINRDVGPALERVLRHCLEKNAEQRFQSARDLAFDLQSVAGPDSAGAMSRPSPPERRARAWLAGAAGLGLAALLIALATRTGLRRWISGKGAAGRIGSVAVLPLRDLSEGPKQEYFVDGMTEALISSLAQIRAIKVISGTSAMQYKETKKPLPQIAKELGVDAVLEGSVARVGNRVRITAQLIQAESDTHLWAKSFERDLRDVLTLQGEVAREVARQIEAELTAEERARLTAKHPVAPRAYEAYLLGRYFLDQGTDDSLKKALAQFTKAIEIDEHYAAPHAGIASYYAILPFYSQLSPAEVFPKARAEALRSLELDEGLAEAHASLAYVRAYYEWDWAAAEREFQRAIALRPSFADAHFSYSRYLAAAGRLDQAIGEIRRAEDLDPRSLSLKANTALLAYFGGRYDDALRDLLQIRTLDPDLPTTHWGIGLAYEQKGMFPEAIAAIERATQLSKSLNLQSSLAHVYAVSGKGEKARVILATLGERSKQGYVPSYFFAVIHTGLGEKDRAFEWLERAYQERSTVLAYLRLDPRLAPLRSDPRFASLLGRIGVTSKTVAGTS